MISVNISRIEATLFIEFIQNMIRDRMITFQNTLEINLESTSSCRSIPLGDKALKDKIQQLAIKPYQAFASSLQDEIRNKTSEYLGFEADLPPIDLDNACHYRVNTHVLHELRRTATFSETTEKLIDKTVDYILPGNLKTSLTQNLIGAVSIGNLLMSVFNINSEIHYNHGKQEMVSILQGIGKNIGSRIGRSLERYYTEQLYELMENQDSSDTAVEDVI